MTDEMHRRMTDTIDHLARIATPLLLVAVVYFVKQIFDVVPVLERQFEVMSVQQQAVVSAVAQVNDKQEALGADLAVVRTKVEVVNEKVNRLERKID